MRQEREGDLFKKANYHFGQLELNHAGDSGNHWRTHSSQCPHLKSKGAGVVIWYTNSHQSLAEGAGVREVVSLL